MIIRATNEMRDVFARKMEADDGTAEGGERALRDGIAAVLAIVERDYRVFEIVLDWQGMPD